MAVHNDHVSHQSLPIPANTLHKIFEMQIPHETLN